MRLFTCALLMICSPAWATLSFSQWKQQREKEAQTLLDRARASGRAENRGKKAIAGASELSQDENGGRFRVSEQAENPVVQAERNLRIARDLSVNDYFVLYLRSQPESTFLKAVEKLSKAHVSELLRAYRARLNSTELSSPPAISTESAPAQSVEGSKP